MRLSRVQIPAIAPLLLNGYALVLNAGLTALLGILFWMVATRLYSQEQVGLAAALISSMTTISYFSQMNLSSFLTRFIPDSGSGAGRLIAKTYATAGLVSALVALLFASGVGIVAEPLEVIGANWGMMLLFVAATVLWTMFALQDAVLAGLRRATLVTGSNTVYALVKIGLLLGFAAFALSPPLGIFFAWTVPLLPIVVAVNLLIRRHVGTLPPEAPHRPLDLRTASQFWRWDFLGSLALGAAFGLAPLMITGTVGVEATAAYHLAWSFAYSIYLVGRAMSTSLVAEGATHPLRLHRLISDSLSHTLALIAGAVAVMLAFAPQIMGLFGPAYVDEGTPLLRLLALSCLPWSVTTLYCAAARVRRRTRTVAIVQVCTLAVFAAVSTALVGSLGAAGVALGWLVAHTAVCAGIVLRVVLADGRIGLVDWALSLAGSGLRLAASLPRPASRKQAQTIPPEVIDGLSRSSLRGLTPVLVKGSLTDVAVLLLQNPDPTDTTPRAVLKFSASANGIAALQRNAATLQSLAADARLAPHSDLLPTVLLAESWGPCFCTAETAVPGIEGRKLPRQGKGMTATMATVIATLANMHRRTAKPTVITDDWARQWIDDPIAAIAAADDSPSRDKRAALPLLRAELRKVFLGRTAPLGLGHGDIWLGNLFFLTDPSEDATLRLSGLIDWDTCRMDSLAALDACQLALTVRMDRSGEEYGPVVRTLLGQGQWTAEETVLFAEAGLQNAFGTENDPELWRGILLLTWLRHVAMVIGQTEHAASRRFWMALNVDLVLAAVLRGARQVAT